MSIREQNKAQYNLDRQTAKISALYDFLNFGKLARKSCRNQKI